LLLAFSDTAWSNSFQNPVFLRDALILATAGAMTARSTVRRLDATGDEGIAARIIRIEELAGVIGLAFVAAFFREHGIEGSWHLPGMVWLLVTLGLGTALGLLFYTMLVATPRGPDFIAVTLGAIAFAAGAAGYLYLSSVAVAFVAGVILANFPGTYQPRLREALKRLERPIYLLALFVIGALWDVDDWRGWVLMPVFMAARLVGKWLAATIAARREHLPVTAQESRSLAVSPIGALAIAIVVNAQLLYPGGSISLVVSAVIGGGVLTEAFVQLATRRSARGTNDPIAPAGDGSSALDMSSDRTPR
jgi:Kef-type K+ transport system membrane component KefB